MKPEARGIRMPALPPLRWLNSPPLRSGDLAGRVVLVEFWDYAGVHCLRPLPYLRAWHERYAEAGLIVVGVHAPEFPFGRDPELVERAVSELAIPYPVALDPDFLAWHAFHNRYWPARYLFDAAGELRYYHLGEGDYAGCEHALQECLSEKSSGCSWPPPPAETPAAPGPHLTSGLYAGLERGGPANGVPTAAGEVTRFALPGRRGRDRVYAEGPWRTGLKCLESVGSDPAALVLRFEALEAHAVLAPVGAEALEIEVALDGRPVPAEDRGADLRLAASGATVLTVTWPRLYRLVRARTHGAHELRLAVDAPGLQVYAFTFTASAAPAETAGEAAAGEPPAGTSTPGPGAATA